MVCLNCVSENIFSVCDYCGECAHLCNLSCPMRVRIRKIKNMRRERAVIFYIKDDPFKRGYVSSNYGEYRPHGAHK